MLPISFYLRMLNKSDSFLTILQTSAVLLLACRILTTRADETCVLKTDSFCTWHCPSSNIDIDLTGTGMLTADAVNYLYSYNPCTQVSCGSDLAVAICQNTTGVPPQTEVVGTLDNKIQLNYSENALTIHYFANTGSCSNNNDDNRKGIINVQSTDSETPTLTFVKEDPKCTYVLNMKSNKFPRKTSSSRLSVGSILCIIFFVSLFLYFLIGFLILRFARGAQGIDQIPNREFWMEIPYLTKDGCCLLVGFCKRPSTYYEKI